MSHPAVSDHAAAIADTTRAIVTLRHEELPEGAPASTLAGAVRAPGPLLDHRVLDGVLQAERVDALLVDRGRIADARTPRSADVELALAAGTSIVVRRAERHDLALRTLALETERATGMRAHVQLFVTPPEQRSLG